MPSPLDIPPIKGVDLEGNEVVRHSSDDEPFSALAFKIMTDPFVGISLTPYVLGLRLYTTLCTENANSAIKYTEGTLNLNSEVYVAWCIDDVDTVLKCASLRLCLFLECPVTSRSCGCDCDTSLLLLLHPVHGSCTFVSITDLIVNTSIIKDTLCRCCLTSIDMSHDSDISGSL